MPAVPKSDEGRRTTWAPMKDRLVSRSADERKWRPEEGLDRWVGKVGAVDRRELACGPRGGRLGIVTADGGTDAMADAAVGVGAARLHIGFIAAVPCIGTLVLVLVVPEVRRLPRLVPTDAGRDRPGRLERQQQHHQDDEELAHEGEVYQPMRPALRRNGTARPRPPSPPQPSFLLLVLLRLPRPLTLLPLRQGTNQWVHYHYQRQSRKPRRRRQRRQSMATSSSFSSAVVQEQSTAALDPAGRVHERVQAVGLESLQDTAGTGATS